MPNSDNNQRSGSGLKTAATFGFGALFGAIAAGAAWYFTEEEQPQSSQRQQQSPYYRANHPVNHDPAVPPRNDTDAEEKDEKDEKDGTVTVCEVCFVSFAELKECGVQIVSTPCGHIYCKDCILGALSIKPECPHCRNEVHDRQLRRLYL